MATTNSVNPLGVEEGEAFLHAALERSEEGRSIQAALEKMGLTAQPERTHLFSVYSAESHRAIAISITPFASEDQVMEGGLSVSEGGHAQAVVVEMRGRTKLVAFTHLAVVNGEVNSQKFDAKKLMSARARPMATEAGKLKTAKPLTELTMRQVGSMSSLTFNNLLNDEFARSVYSQKEITALRSNATIVSEISRFVLMRTSGSSCCSCSTSCWGSCSSSCSYGG